MNLISVAVFDAKGMLVAEHGSGNLGTQVQMDLDLESGAYLVQLQFNEGVANKRFMVY